MTDSTRTVARTTHVYCGNYTCWRGFFTEPDECDWEADVPLPESPEEDEFASFVCGGCGATNTVRDHEVENRSAFPERQATAWNHVYVPGDPR